MPYVPKAISYIQNRQASMFELKKSSNKICSHIEQKLAAIGSFELGGF